MNDIIIQLSLHYLGETKGEITTDIKKSQISIRPPFNDQHSGYKYKYLSVSI